MANNIFLEQIQSQSKNQDGVIMVDANLEEVSLFPLYLSSHLFTLELSFYVFKTSFSFSFVKFASSEIQNSTVISQLMLSWGPEKKSKLTEK